MLGAEFSCQRLCCVSLVNDDALISCFNFDIHVQHGVSLVELLVHEISWILCEFDSSMALSLQGTVIRSHLPCLFSTVFSVVFINKLLLALVIHSQ